MDRITGRNDDMLIIRGVNIFPRQIEELIVSEPGLSAHYRIDVTRDGTMDSLTVTCEALHTTSRIHGACARNSRARMKSTYGLTADIAIVLPGTLRAVGRQGKTRVRSSQGEAVKLEADHGGEGIAPARAAAWARRDAESVDEVHRRQPLDRTLDRAGPARPRRIGARERLQPERACGRCRELVRACAVERDRRSRPFDGWRVALALASGAFGISPARVFGLGIKVSVERR